MTASELPHAPLTVAAVAARLGVAASTLRTWDRRYGLGPTSHEAGSHRRYSPADVARLERMRALTLQGVAPMDAARIVLDEAHDEGRREENSTEVPAATLAVVNEDPQILTDPLTLVAAALEPDAPRVERILGHAIQRMGLVRAFAEVVRPALELLREKPRVDRPGVEPHALIVAIMSQLLGRLPYPTPARNTPTVAVVSGQHGQLSGQVIAAALAKRGARVCVLRPAYDDGASEVLALMASQNATIIIGVGQLPYLGELMTEVSKSAELSGYLVGNFVTDVWAPHIHRFRTVAAVIEDIGAVLGL
ncbi:MAG: MerR family transcriptional regulator [Bowdeniella nasicola]|nr:MerR family transcriptional regulator [Bowdeniella nasicola]